MKKYIFVPALLLFVAFSAQALLSGDEAPEPEKLQFLQEMRKPIFRFDTQKKPAQLKVLVFLNTRSAACREAIPLLVRLGGQYKERNVELIAVSTDTEAQCRELLREFPAFTFPFAREERPLNTQRYMAGSVFFPKAFIVDASRKILWDGEVIDLEDALESNASGRFDAAKQRKLSPLLSQLQSALRDADDDASSRIAADIFKLDPANAPALRLRLYSLESSGRAEDAVRFLGVRRAAAPAEARLYFMALDLVSRYPAFAEQLLPFLEAYPRQVPRDPERDAAFAWQLLLRQPLSAPATKCAAELLAPETAGTPGTLAPRALLAARAGKPENALRIQERITKLCRDQKLPQLPESLEMEQYYRELLRLRGL